MKKRILSVLITLVMLIGLVSVMSVCASAAGVTDEIHWAVVQKDSDVILYLGNAAHVMETGETLYADGAQGTDDMVFGSYRGQPYEAWYMEITKVVVESEIQPASCAYWFYDLYKCTEMDLQLLNTGSVTSMKAMFTHCSSMTTLTWDTSKFTTANVTTMESMFSSCEKLTSLDLSHFDTSNVTNMANMFYQCNNLETIDLSSFDTAAVTNMAFMFYACYDLAYLDLSSFDLSGIAASSNKSLLPFAEILTLKTPKINPYADTFGLTYTYSDEQGNLYTALPVSESAEGVKTLYKNSSIYYYMNGSTGGEGNPTRYAYDKAYSITLTAPQKAGYIFDGWKVDEGLEGVTVVGNTLTIPQYTTGTVYIDTLWKPYTVSVSGSYAPYTATIDPSRDDVTYSWHEYSFGSSEITDESAIYDSEYSFGTYDPETGWTPDSIEYLYLYFDVSLKSGDTVTVTFADDVDVEAVAMMTGDWGYLFFGEAQAENVILFTIPEDGRYVLVTNRIETTAKAIYAGVSVSNTAAFTGTTFSTGEIGKQYVAKATFTDGGKGIVAYSAPFTYAEQYTVTFDYGTLGSETKTVLSGETVTPPAPVFGGKVLVGWYTNSSFATEFDFSDAIYANKTIYAKFTEAVAKIEKTGTSGLVDTYTITYTDGTTTTFTVTNGEKGDKGDQGIQGIQGVPGADGHTPVITIQNGYWYIDGVNTNQAAQGVKGDTGNGISDISKTGTNGLVDTYTITYTDGTTTTFTVTNGEKGDKGDKGDTGAQGGKGEKGNTGAAGADGVGIANIEKTPSDGNVDTYTITLTNGTTYTFTVTNGTNGTDGKDGKDGVDGKDGTNGTNGVDGKDGTDGEDGQTPYIGENGNWWIGDTDTGVKAAGDDGKDSAIIVATAVGGTALISNIALIAWTLIKKKRLF